MCLQFEHEPRIAGLPGDEHRHLCKTGPCKYTIVKPFLYRGPVVPATGYPQAEPLPARLNRVTDNPTRQAPIPGDQITAVILAGGQARRMGGQDKGLVELNGRPMIEHIIDALKPQVDRIVISANRNIERYQRYGFPVIKDIMGDYFGPLAGMASAAQASESPWLLTVPCDSPFVPAELAATLYHAVEANQAEISVAHDGDRMQPVFALLQRDLLPSLLAYLEDGGRKIDTWYAQHRLALADFSQWPDAFLNINTPDERNALERKMEQPGEPVPAT